ncbi:MAG: hypothetical protein LBG62_01600 [Candidatus Methanoplasma sp.]|jgi:membrane protein implicated in regulation of membrane protease activity|nr:hypothetical protein [Candidatus Methanoplasma sp.]
MGGEGDVTALFENNPNGALAMALSLIAIAAVVAMIVAFAEWPDSGLMLLALAFAASPVAWRAARRRARRRNPSAPWRDGLRRL